MVFLVDTIKQNSSVELHFELKSLNGDVLDSTYERDEPVEVTLGDGSLLDGFEACLIGMQAGDYGEFFLRPEQAFGLPDPAKIERVDKTQLAGNIPVETGNMVSFGDRGDSAPLLGMIVAVDDSTITVDFNHPLAGNAILFCAKVVSVSSNRKN